MNINLFLLGLTFIIASSRKAIFIAAPPTAFSQDGSVNLSVISDQALMLTDNKVDGVFVTGTTGESLSLSTTERQQILEEWIKTKKLTPYPLMIIMHCGAESLEVAHSLAQFAEKAGADAIGAMPPTFFKVTDPVVLAESMAQIANGINLPFYYYHIPTMTGANVQMIDFIPEAISRIPNFKGIKYTDYDLYGFGLCVTYMKSLKSDHQMLFGHDEIMLAAYLFGASGFVGSTYNFAGNFYHNILDLYDRGNLTAAWEQQSISQLMVKAMLAPEGATPGTKAIMQLKGVPVGPCRLPLVTVNEQQKQVLEKELKKLGFL